MKIVSDTFASEQKIDGSMDEMRAQQEQLKQETLENKKSIKEIQEQREKLMGDYNVTEESQEHKDLELLRKETSGGKLSDEEKERLATIHENGLTNYQKDMLELDGQEEVYQRLASQKESAFKSISGSLADMQIERLKKHPMVDSTKQADEIMEAANKDLYAESKDHIDEKMEEAKEKAEEKAEKKEEEETKEAERKKDKLELEKQIEQAKQNAAEAAGSEIRVPDQPSMDTSDMQEIIDQNSNGTNDTTKIEREIEKLVEELGLIMEDLKGSKVDMSI